MSATIEQAPHRIIVIDDMESIHEDFRKTLEERISHASVDDQEAALFGTKPQRRRACCFTVDSALQGEEGFKKVFEARNSGNPYAVAFVDMRMPPGWDGLQTIEQLWRVDPDLQVVICTAYSDHSWDQIIERLGVNDKLLILKKPFDRVEVNQLATALTQKWAVSKKAVLKMDELERLVEHRTQELHHAAVHDRLTGMINRAGFMDRLGRTVLRGKPGESYAVLFLDFDRFKLVNDSLGHEAGDQMLVQIADRMRGALNEWNVAEGDHWSAARFGGDEFVILLDRLGNPNEAGPIADALLAKLRHPYQIDGHVVHSTASIGLTTSAFDYCRPEDALSHADAAMYRAKAAGRDRWVQFDKSMHAEALSRLEMETQIRQAVLGDQFVPYYQAIIDTQSGNVLGAESLVRWNHPIRGIVSPMEFIQLAEEIGAIGKIGAMMRRAAVEQLKIWRAGTETARRMYITVNVSKRELIESGFVASVADLLKETELDPAALHLEITESTIMADPEAVAPILTALKLLGVVLAMDDFGTGHSSLTCLHRFPIDVLKIDRAFIQNVVRSSDYAAVVQAIVVLAQNLRMRVIAEGIEDTSQLALIQALDCSCAQGYLFGKPCPASEFDLRPRLAPQA